MTRAKNADFPELRRFFGGYMHEDFVQEYGSPTGALAAFEADASPAERRRLHAEAAQLLTLVESQEFSTSRALLSELGCRWAPKSSAALRGWLAAAATKH